MKRRIKFIEQNCDVVRVIAHIMEIHINGGSVAEKIKFGLNVFEKHLPVASVFHENEWKGVVNRWGVTRLPRKTHRGLRMVACIGSWHPARVQFNIAREGQKGYHHRTEIHKKIYKIGAAITYDEVGKPTNFSASTEYDMTAKNIAPVGGFVRCVARVLVLFREHVWNTIGVCAGTVPRKRPITLRKAIIQPSTTAGDDDNKQRIIDTASKYGHGRFQTSEEKKAWNGKSKKDKAGAYHDQLE